MPNTETVFEFDDDFAPAVGADDHDPGSNSVPAGVVPTIRLDRENGFDSDSDDIIAPARPLGQALSSRSIGGDLVASPFLDDLDESQVVNILDYVAPDADDDDQAADPKPSAAIPQPGAIDCDCDGAPAIPNGAPVKRRVGLADFDIMSVIGTGAYGKVFLVKKKTNSHLFAMKVLKKASIVIHAKETEHTITERSILERVQHPFIVKLHYAFQTSSKLYLILDYCQGGELFSYLAREKMVSEDVAAFYSGELILALEHLHSLGIIYRDLKPENVLLNKDGHVVLTDFGLSKVAVDARTVCGTVEYMAPETINESTAYDKTVDYWSLGIMIYDMITGSPPFSGNNRKKVMDSILNKKITYPNYISSFAKDLLIKLLRKNPAQRLGHGDNGVAQIKKHGFYRKINWTKLANLDVDVPLKPLGATSSTDLLANFDSHFTSMPLESPSQDLPPELMDERHSQLFRGFSFVASTSEYL